METTMIATLRGLISRDDLRRWIALVVVCFGQLMTVLDTTIVNVALPSIQRDLGFSQANLTWVVNGYSISYGGFVLLAGRLGDLVGRKRVFLVGVLLFTVASVLCGAAVSPGLLVAARLIQGLGGALSTGVIIAMIVTTFTGTRERAQAMSVFAFTIAGGGSLGLLAGGFLTQAASWHWIFFVNVPIGAATLIAGALLIRDDRGIGLSHGVDVAGSVLVTTAVMAVAYTIVTAPASGWTSLHTLGLGATSFLLLGGFVGLQARLSNPIMPPRILSIRSLVGGSAARGLLAVGIFTTFFLGALYLQQVRGFTSFGTGLAFLPHTLALGVMSSGITVRLVGRFGPRRVLVAGLVLIMTALVLLATTGPQTVYFPRLLITFALFGTGAGMTFMPLTLLTMADVPAADAGLAAGIANVSMQVSAALGLAALGTIAADRSRSLLADGTAGATALTGGYQLAFAMAAGLVAAALVVVLLTLRAPKAAPAPAAVEEPEELRQAA
jgi:EmrB/QacA subfamily drug resistance transporter